jgi:uncharacterized protein
MALIDALAVAPSMERLRLDSELGALVGSRCEACNAVSWPSRAVCYRCGSAPMSRTVLCVLGNLITHTTVWIARPGLDPPYSMGQVAIDDGPLVFAHVRDLGDNRRVPVRVRLQLADDIFAVPPFWFVPDEGWRE